MKRLRTSAGSSAAGLLLLGTAALLAQAKVPAPAGFPASGQPPIVKLVYPGAEPRHPIRYAIANGRSEHFTMDLSTDLALQMAGVSLPSFKLPTMRMAADVVVTGLTASGDVSYTVAMTDFKLVNTADVDPNILAALQGSSADVKSITGGATISARGISRDTKLDTSKVTNRQMAEMINSLTSTIQQLSLPFPEEAVGSGAEWEVRQTSVVNSAQTFQHVTVDLVSLDDASCTLKLMTDLTAPPQPVTAVGLPADVQASLENMRGSGTGTVTIHFNSLVPTSQGSMSTSATIYVAKGGDSQLVSTQTTVRVSVAPAK